VQCLHCQTDRHHYFYYHGTLVALAQFFKNLINFLKNISFFLNAEIFKKNNFLEEKYFVNENEESI